MDEPGAPSATPHIRHAHHAFLAGCELPRRWRGLPRWRVLATGFGCGLGFLATWQAWRADPQRPRMLHFVAVDAIDAPACPSSRAELLRTLSNAFPDPDGLRTALADQWHGLLPGLHRLSFDGGQVLLTLCIGALQPMLRAQRFEADSIFFDGTGTEGSDAMAAPDTLKALARFAHPGTRLAARTTGAASATVRDALARHGFRTIESPGSPPDAAFIEGDFAPAWTVRRRAPPPAPVDAPGHCAVVGAGLAGAAVAASLARRGWRVTVLEAGAHGAAGASGVPVGVLAPHVSPDDALLSRLTRAGARMTWQQVRALLRDGEDWHAGGVLERRASRDGRLPAGWRAEGPNESWHATPAQLQAAGLPADSAASWHARGGWVKPARLVEAWLGRPGVRLRTNARVARIDAPASANASPRWALRDADGRLLVEADRVVIAAGFESATLAPDPPLQPVRGQVAWGRMPPASTPSSMHALPPMPLNGDGHLIAHVPDAAGAFWLTGATFDRDRRDTVPTAADTEANRVRLARLHPAASAVLAPAFAAAATSAASSTDHGAGAASAAGSGDAVRAWVGVRCASADRRPLVGPLDAAAPDGPWLCTAMGSRGLSFAVLCAELLAARWHGEPLPLPTALADALDAGRTGRTGRTG